MERIVRGDRILLAGMGAFPSPFRCRKRGDHSPCRLVFFWETYCEGLLFFDLLCLRNHFNLFNVDNEILLFFEKLNYNVYAILLSIANFTPKKEATLKEFLSTNKDVLFGVKTFGKYNVLLYICTTNPDDLIKTTAELRSHFIGDVRDYETLINYEEYKYTYFPEQE
jgi:hypothetical protein